LSLLVGVEVVVNLMVGAVEPVGLGQELDFQ
jgi:hypothetical protein